MGVVSKKSKNKLARLKRVRKEFHNKYNRVKYVPKTGKFKKY